MRSRLGLAFAGSFLLATARVHAADKSCSNQDSPAKIEARVHQIIAAMTIPERIAQLQDRAPAVPRLGLPAYNWWNEGLHGLARDGYATVFPQAIGLAATWDAKLLQDVGDVVSTEARAKFNGHGHKDTPRYGGLTIWSPNINIFRDPRWGRGQETYGEDPFLTATLGVAFVHGVQGTDPFYLKANATPKHFAVHSGPERNRDSFNSVVSAHDLADTYLRAFHAVTTEGHAAAMMCSYNEINGVPSCANEATLRQTVRDRWGFRGYVVSDCDAVGDISAYHHFAKDDAHAAALALKAGTDLDCGNTYAALQASYDQKLVTEVDLNDALYRLLMARVKLGMLDATGCTPFDKLGAEDVDSAKHRALAVQAAEESIVLLKNDGTLPLQPGARIAVVGPTADSLKNLEANYHGTAREPITPLTALLATNPDLTYAQGSLLADGVSAPIPRSALHLTAAPNSQEGLHAEYFNAPSFSAQPTVQRELPTLDLDLDRVGPDAAVTSKQYAARWQGFLSVPAPGDYDLRVHVERCWDCTTHDTFRLFVDGRLALENHGQKNEPDHIQQHFSNATPHAIRLEYIHSGEDEGVALEWVPPSSALLQQAKQEVKNADVIVAFLGLSPDLEGEALQLELPGFDGGDRTSLELPQTQQQLLREMQKLGKPVVVVLSSGSAVTLGPGTKAPAALLQAWYPGESGGSAVAEVLAGKVNPSGRLPVTFYRSVADLPAFSDYSMAQRTYRYYQGPVFYPFGYGLSYTSFTYGPAVSAETKLTAGQPLTVEATLHNAGSRAGTEVTELYLSPPSLPGAPRLMLAGVRRTTLQPGESKVLQFTLDASHMATADDAGSRAVRPGTYRLYLGGTQPLEGQRSSLVFQVSGTQQVP